MAPAQPVLQPIEVVPPTPVAPPRPVQQTPQPEQPSVERKWKPIDFNAAMQQRLAEEAGVSRITVWKVLNDRPGVSEELRQLVRRKAEELGYGVPGVQPSRHGRTFSVAVARPESSIFWMNIIHHIAKELAKQGANMLYTYMPTGYHEGYALPAPLTQAEVDGFLVLNVYDRRLLEMLAATSLPKVFLDTVPTLHPRDLHGDLVILEGQNRIHEITSRLLSTGRTRLGFIGDVNYAQTNLDRYRGFLDAHTEAGIAPDPAWSLTEPLRLRDHYEQISEFLARLPRLPDAFVCASDFIASFVHRYLEESGRQLPEAFVLTGFDNSAEYPGVAEKITSVNVETSSLGKLLARKLMFRADYPSAPTEVSYVDTQVVYRKPLK